MKYRNYQHNERRNQVIKGVGIAAACLAVVAGSSMLVSAGDTACAAAAVAAVLGVLGGALVWLRKIEKESMA